MAYTKQTWSCGDEITAEKLNHMEDGIAEGGCDCGFECEVTEQVLTDETVTTESSPVVGATGNLSYTGYIDADEINVTFDGTEYTFQKNIIGGVNSYGGLGTQGPDFSVYPVAIVSINGSGNRIHTETSGTYTVKIEAVETTLETTDCFEKAVQSAVSIPILRVPFEFVASIGEKSTVLASEVDEAIANGYFIFGTFKEIGENAAIEYWRFIEKTSDSEYNFQTPNGVASFVVSSVDGYLVELQS